ncbi:MAG TPA: SDR family NAD(P)-dependent oxidoreductase, partial [Streptosporangiaceae bacterium]|nr:SDR family NAD(P)-dependent oxidoreductase [Streptosporangiaceae bacterium]
MDEQTADHTVNQSVDQTGRESGDRQGSGDQNMHGRVALVAGASKGIGAATAEAFAAAGAAVVLASRDTAALEAIADRI